MKIEVVARSPDQAIAFMSEACECRGPMAAVRTGWVRRHHDDVSYNLRRGLGEVWPVFTVQLTDDCQAHISEFVEQPKIEENDMWVLPRAFCAMMPPCERLGVEEEYIIA